MKMIEDGRANEFVEKRSRGIAKMGAAVEPRPVIVRLADLNTNEYAALKGGKKYEKADKNPIMGWRVA